MKLITAYELDALSETDLKALFERLSKTLPRTDAGTAERRNALASLEGIGQRLNRAHARPLAL